MIKTCKNCENFKLSEDVLCSNFKINKYILNPLNAKSHYDYVIKQIICFYNYNVIFNPRKTLIIEDCISTNNILKDLKIKIKRIDYYAELGIGEYKIYRSLYNNILYRIKKLLKIEMEYINFDDNKYLKDI